MAINPLLPIRVDNRVQGAYVALNLADIIYTNFETSTTLTSTTGDARTLTESICSLTANLTGSNSAHYHVVRKRVADLGFEPSFTAFTDGMGIYSFRKRYFDAHIKKGTLTAIVDAGDTVNAGDYRDSGSGAMLNESDEAVGVMLNDDGMFVITSSASSLVTSITSVKYQAYVENTELSVFCTCQPGELNYTLNPSALNVTAGGNYLDGALTGSTKNAEFYPELVSSGIVWQPHITHVGLYDDDNNLLVVGKLTRPLRKPTDIPLTIRVKIDL